MMKDVSGMAGPTWLHYIFSSTEDCWVGLEARGDRVPAPGGRREQGRRPPLLPHASGCLLAMVRESDFDPSPLAQHRGIFYSNLVPFPVALGLRNWGTCSIDPRVRATRAKVLGHLDRGLASWRWICPLGEGNASLGTGSSWPWSWDHPRIYFLYPCCDP